MLTEEVVGVDPSLVAVSHLVARLVADFLRELRGVERSAGLDLICGREVNLLRGQLVADLSCREGAQAKREDGCSDQNDDHDRLKTDDSPPYCRVHVDFLLTLVSRVLNLVELRTAHELSEQLGGRDHDGLSARLRGAQGPPRRGLWSGHAIERSGGRWSQAKEVLRPKPADFAIATIGP